jgi:hypothetical protein
MGRVTPFTPSDAPDFITSRCLISWPFHRWGAFLLLRDVVLSHIVWASVSYVILAMAGDASARGTTLEVRGAGPHLNIQLLLSLPARGRCSPMTARYSFLLLKSCDWFIVHSC